MKKWGMEQQAKAQCSKIMEAQHQAMAEMLATQQRDVMKAHKEMMMTQSAEMMHALLHYFPVHASQSTSLFTVSV